jgi:hypothetical protein
MAVAKIESEIFSWKKGHGKRPSSARLTEIVVIGEKEIVLTVEKVLVFSVSGNDIVCLVLLDFQPGRWERIPDISCTKTKGIDPTFLFIRILAPKAEIEKPQSFHQVDDLFVSIPPVNIGKTITQLDGPSPLEAPQRQPGIFRPSVMDWEKVEKGNAEYHKYGFGKRPSHPFPLSHCKNRLLKLDPWIWV